MGMMPRRYRHWIQQATEGRWPTDILCVDCVPELAVIGRDGNRMQERLSSYHAVLLHRMTSDYVQLGDYSGTNAAEFLSRLAEASIYHPNIWLLSYQCARQWAMLGVWEGIESGSIAIADTDARAGEAVKGRLRDYRLRQADPLRTLGGEEGRRVRQEGGGYLVCEDPPNILRCRLNGSPYRVTWVDARNYGIESIPEAMPGAEIAHWLARFIRRVCWVCREAGLTALKATVNSQAMSAWRHSHLTESVHVHTDPGATAMECGAYFGGRCEAARLGVIPTPVYHVDFRSQYGWVCACCPLPTRLLCHSECAAEASSIVRGGSEGTIADVTVETDEPAYPVRRDELVIYPVGRYRTVLCGPELGDALRADRIREVHAVAVYGMGYPLRSYAQSVYALRLREEQEGIPGVATWVKRLIVGLPGKLGQRDHRWVDCPDVAAQYPYGEWYEEGDGEDVIRYRSLGGIVQRDCVGGYAADSIPSIAAFVTSYGRMRLLAAIRVAGWENVYYYDTDSLMVNAEGYSRLRDSEFMTGDGMGQLTLRGQPEYLEIRGVKYYVSDRKVTCSGLLRGNIEDLGDGRNYARHLSPIDQARAGKRPEAAVVHGTYPRAGEYNLGTVRPDGRVEPFRLEE